MKTFRELVSEGSLPPVAKIKKTLKAVDFQNINPEFFSIEKKNSDAGMGGYDYIQITFDAKDAQSPKRAEDVKLGLAALEIYHINSAKVKDGIVTIY